MSEKITFDPKIQKVEEISQELKALVEEGFIEKAGVSSTGKITYVMNSVPRAFMRSFINANQEIYDFYSELEALKHEMNQEKVEIENLYGFEDVYELITVLTSSLPLVNLVLKALNKELEELKK
jgi:hypothetical protein